MFHNYNHHQNSTNMILRSSNSICFPLLLSATILLLSAHQHHPQQQIFVDAFSLIHQRQQQQPQRQKQTEQRVVSVSSSERYSYRRRWGRRGGGGDGSSFLLFLSSSSVDNNDPATAETAATTSCAPKTDDANDRPVEGMRIKEIQNELRERDVSYQDCFDRESLTKRLLQARQQQEQQSCKRTPEQQQPTQQQQQAQASCNPVVDDDPVDVSSSCCPQPPQEETPTLSTTTTATNNNKKAFDRETVTNEYDSKRIRELREECSSNNIRWANFIEKRDIVNALVDFRQRVHGFSVTGEMVPGKVTDLTGIQLEQELQTNTAGGPNLLLLDVYATWCGPCQMMIPILNGVAEELGASVRVAKIDSDKFAREASQFNVGGLPTILLLDTSTDTAIPKELHRVEGVIQKDDLLQVVQKYL